MTGLHADRGPTSPSPKRKRINPILLDQGEDTKSLEEPAFHFYTRNQILAAQLTEAEAHSYNVEHGICWQELYSGHPPLEPSAIAYGDLPPEMLKLLTWSGSEKAIFIELLGRRSASALPEIAAILGKSYFECQTYLHMLREASANLAIDFADIPAAEDVPEALVEPDFDEPQPRVRSEPSSGTEVINESGSEPDTERNLFVHKRLAFISGKSRTSFSDKPLQAILRHKLSEWIEESLVKALNANSFTVEEDIVESIVSGCSDLDDSGFTLASADSTVLEDFAADEDEDIDEDRVDNLILKETQWLEQLDAFNSAVSLHMRGLLPRSEVGNPPDARDPDLQKFMQSKKWKCSSC